MSLPLNTSYTDSSHKVPHTSPDKEETSRPIERPEVVQKQPRGKGGQSGPVSGGEGATWASRGALNSGPWGHQARGNSAGLRVRQVEEQQVFRASAKGPHGLNQAAGPCTEQGVGVCGLGVSSPLGLFQDSEKVPETSELRLSGTFSFRENCHTASHRIVTLCGRQGWSCYSILQMENLRFTRFRALSRATQKCRYLSFAPLRGECGASGSVGETEDFRGWD